MKKIKTSAMNLKQELMIEDPTLRVDEYGAGYKFSGRLKNISDEYSLTNISLNIIFKDLENDTSKILEEKSTTLHHITVHPGKSSEFSTPIYSWHLAPKGKLDFDYEITGLNRKEPLALEH